VVEEVYLTEDPTDRFLRVEVLARSKTQKTPSHLVSQLHGSGLMRQEVTLALRISSKTPRAVNRL
jgi:hypothetical protein